MYFSLIIDIQCRVERVYEKQKRLTPMDVEQELDRQDAAYLLFYFEGMWETPKMLSHSKYAQKCVSICIRPQIPAPPTYFA